MPAVPKIVTPVYFCIGRAQVVYGASHCRQYDPCLAKSDQYNAFWLGGNTESVYSCPEF